MCERIQLRFLEAEVGQSFEALGMGTTSTTSNINGIYI